MKTYKLILLLTLLMTVMSSLKSQTINWGSLDSNDIHILNVNAGVEYGAVFGVGYAYHIKSKLFPMVANLEYSFPAGGDLFDDLKIKTGMQLSLIEFHHFHFSTRLHGVIRRYENDNVRLVNFGSDLTGVIGYYRKKWFVAGETGFDKAIITHFKHTEAYEGQYPGVADGWFGPTTGGNFYYGIQAGYSFGQSDLYLKTGKILTQDFKTAPTLPMYGQVGYNLKF